MIKVAKSVLDLNTDNSVTELHDAPLRSFPDCRSDRPGAGNLEWHAKNVFRDGYSVVTGTDH